MKLITSFLRSEPNCLVIHTTNEGGEQPRQHDFHGLETREFHQELTAVGIVRRLGHRKGFHGQSHREPPGKPGGGATWYFLCERGKDLNLYQIIEPGMSVSVPSEREN